MQTLRKQRTLSTTATIEGFGYWSGRDVRVEFRPAEPNTGIVFVRRDMARPARIKAVVAHRIETPRRTTLSAGGGSVEMVEHILAALAGLHIDNCEVWVNEPEMPGCDGSSEPFAVVFEAAGIVEQDELRRQLVVRTNVRLGDSESWVEARPAPAGGMSIRFCLEYAQTAAIGQQTFEMAVTPEVFRRELAPARTFMLAEEAEWLQARGLGRRATHKHLLVFGEDGPIDNKLRYADECVRHKTLDLVGDLALAGCDLVGHFTAHRSGHRLNAELVRALVREEQGVEAWRRSA